MLPCCRVLATFLYDAGNDSIKIHLSAKEVTGFKSMLLSQETNHSVKSGFE